MTISKLKKIIFQNFINKNFLIFILIGLINVINGVWIAYFYSLFINNVIISYIFGFLTSLCISYILNSIFNFKDKICFNKFIKFVINNIPNFVIQILSIIIFYEILSFPKLVSYIISAIIAVPLTFILIKYFVYKNG